MRTEPNTTADPAAGEGRRISDRRASVAAMEITNRRAAERRSSKDRRAAPRS